MAEELQCNMSVYYSVLCIVRGTYIAARGGVVCQDVAFTVPFTGRHVIMHDMIDDTGHLKSPHPCMTVLAEALVRRLVVDRVHGTENRDSVLVSWLAGLCSSGM